MRLHASVTFAALYLLQCLTAHFPATKGSSGHRLFISAVMLASKIICDDTFSNKSWCIVGQGMFTLREINQMEWEMCSYWSGSSMLILQHCVTFKLMSNTTLPVQAPIRRRSSLSQLPLHLPTKAPVISMAPLCLLSLPISPCLKMLQSSPVRR
jgi:cyclin-like protein